MLGRKKTKGKGRILTVRKLSYGDYFSYFRRIRSGYFGLMIFEGLRSEFICVIGFFDFVCAWSKCFLVYKLELEKDVKSLYLEMLIA